MKFARLILMAMTAIAALTSVPTTRAQAAGFDGSWSVLVITDQGPCDRAYRYPVQISRGKVGHSDPSNSSFNIGGRVEKGGSVRVFVSRGNQRADGVGRLTNAGGGSRWKSASGECSGRWTAERRGVAQLVRVLACHARSRGFESVAPAIFIRFENSPGLKRAKIPREQTRYILP